MFFFYFFSKRLDFLQCLYSYALKLIEAMIKLLSDVLCHFIVN